MSTLFVDDINEKTSGNGVLIPGHVVQVVHHTSGDGSELSTTGTTYVSGGAECTVTITPSSTSSRILVMANFNADTANSDERVLYTFFKSSGGGTAANVISANSEGYDALVRIHEGGSRLLVNQTMVFYDDPNSTASQAYTIYFRGQNSGETARVRNDITPSQLVAMEIAQ